MKPFEANVVVILSCTNKIELNLVIVLLCFGSISFLEEKIGSETTNPTSTPDVYDQRLSRTCLGSVWDFPEASAALPLRVESTVSVLDLGQRSSSCIRSRVRATSEDADAWKKVTLVNASTRIKKNSFF